MTFVPLGTSKNHYFTNSWVSDKKSLILTNWRNETTYPVATNNNATILQAEEKNFTRPNV
jgi:hypothetical protein